MITLFLMWFLQLDTHSYSVPLRKMKLWEREQNWKYSAVSVCPLGLKSFCFVCTPILCSHHQVQYKRSPLPWFSQKLSECKINFPKSKLSEWTDFGNMHGGSCPVFWLRWGFYTGQSVLWLAAVIGLLNVIRAACISECKGGLWVLGNRFCPLLLTCMELFLMTPIFMMYCHS